MSTSHTRDERGQVLVIVALGLIGIIAMVGLVVDGGYAWSQQRVTQNAADSVAEAGAIVLMENVAGTVPTKTDADVLAAVNRAATNNGFGAPVAYYTDFNGNLLDATGAVTADPATAALVGSGAIPTGAKGVKANAKQTVNTFLMPVIGIPTLDIEATATARAGFRESVCEAEAGCIVLPVTVPTTVIGCDGSNNLDQIEDASGNPVLFVAPSEYQTVPLCKNSPGNVGWLDWTPTAGGTSELVDAILTPSNPRLEWPQWYYITSTGNVNSAPVENALRTYDGDLVSIPMFDATCDEQPTGPFTTDCPIGHLGGNGSNQWYHLASMAGFRFCSSAIAECAALGLDHGAYINGSNKIPCDTGNGGTSCLAGRFEVISDKGEVSEAPPPTGTPGSVTIQLIR
ncbi:pilus assembly protein TadG-related protein [Mycobacterium sp.]|uniref:pilus assembly protein TadG-related protein n=1 Tax=Mycobacterium sp. TaxID=1785 RepID=UPI002DA1586D|nr:pilus assembly protein TadG-related protein [Mycobacterium sp.]